MKKILTTLIAIIISVIVSGQTYIYQNKLLPIQIYTNQIV